jgi:hypothetical protein
MIVVTLEQVSPFIGDTPETIRYRHCDFCSLSACEDLWAGKRDEADWRTFYRLVDGCCVCGVCLDDGVDIE